MSAAANSSPSAACAKSGITVAVRVRPLNERERKVYRHAAWKVDSGSNTLAQLDAGGQLVPSAVYSFGTCAE